ncbi:unnamed protein product [Urochloa humidicola]
MDSGNSGSLQSSSGGGDDDFDAASGGGSADSSTTSPLAALLRHPGFSGGSPLIYGLQDLAGAPPLSSHWCSTTTTAAPHPPRGAVSSPPPSLMSYHGGRGLVSAASAPAADQTATAAAAATQQQQPSAPPPPPRGPSRKRARASRRAPTTVLTTDTSNFRAMVQEFTGIPAPPFAAAGAAARSRLDSLLFPSRSAAAAALPQFLLRPFAHKPQAFAPPFTSPSTSSPAAATAAIAAPAGDSTAAMASGDGYQHHFTTAAPSALLGMQDHGSGGEYLSFQTALAGHLDGVGGDAGKYPLFDRGVAPPSERRPLADPADFMGLAHGVVSSEGHLHQRNGDRGGHGSDELLSGLVGGCKATYSTALPPLGRNRRGPPAGVSTATTTAAAAATAPMMRTQAADSWVCSTSE